MAHTHGNDSVDVVFSQLLPAAPPPPPAHSPHTPKRTYKFYSQMQIQYSAVQSSKIWTCSFARCKVHGAGQGHVHRSWGGLAKHKWRIATFVWPGRGGDSGNDSDGNSDSDSDIVA